LEVNCPVLVIHSIDDEIIPYEHGKEIFENISTPKQFLEISGDHNMGFLTSGHTYIDGLEEFMGTPH